MPIMEKLTTMHFIKACSFKAETKAAHYITIQDIVGQWRETK